MYKKTILMAGIFGMLATSSVYAEEFPIEGVTIEGSTEIAIGETDENGNPIPITIGNTLTEEEKEQRKPVLSIEETGEGYHVTVELSEAGKNNGDALVDLTVTDSGGNEVYFEKVAASEDEGYTIGFAETVSLPEIEDTYTFTVRTSQGYVREQEVHYIPKSVSAEESTVQDNEAPVITYSGIPEQAVLGESYELLVKTNEL